MTATARFQWGTAGVPGGVPEQDQTFTECAWSMTLDADLVKRLARTAKAKGISQSEALAAIVVEALRPMPGEENLPRES